MNLFQFALAFALLVISRVITFPVEDLSSTTDQITSIDQDILECNATRNEIDAHCACSVINRTFVLCCQPNTISNLCIDDDQADNSDQILSISIIYSPMTSLVISKDVWTRLGVKDITLLKQFRVSNTSLTELQVCRNEKNSDIPSPDKIRSDQISRLKRFVSSRRQDASTNRFSSAENSSNEIEKNSTLEMFFCEDFARLNRFDINGNQMRYLHNMNMPNLDRLYIGGNQWSCFHSNGGRKHTENEMSWLLNYKDAVADSPRALCIRPRSNKWHQSNNGMTNVTLLHFLEFDKEVISGCPSNCSCHIININDPLWVKVNCAELNLTSLPEILPPNTQVLNVSYNLIQSLLPLRDNPHYAKLKQLIAPDNYVTSLDEIIGSPFINNKPTTLNLQLNRISNLNVELLRSILSRIDTHHDSVNFLFAYNPWECTCEKVKSMQNFVYEFKNWLRDYDILACGMDESPLLVSFDYNSFCPVEVGIDYMAILVVIEVLLLALILSKLSYDVLQYRRTGELPWLARHICLGYNYSNLNKSSSVRPQQNSSMNGDKRGGTFGQTIDDDKVQFVDNKSDTNMSDTSQLPSRANRYLVDCLVCVGIKSNSEGETKEKREKKLSRGLNDVVTFRPRRQTEHSMHSRPSESSANSLPKSSPISLSAVTLRKTSKMGPNSPRKSPPQSKSTRAVKLPTLLPTNLLASNKDPVLEIKDDEINERNLRILYLRGLKGSTSEDRLSFRTVMEPMEPMEPLPKSSFHTRNFTSPDNRFLIGLNNRGMKRNISKSTSTLQNSVAL